MGGRKCTINDPEGEQEDVTLTKVDEPGRPIRDNSRFVRKEKKVPDKCGLTDSIRKYYAVICESHQMQFSYL